MESSIDSDSVVISCSSVVNQHSNSEYIEVRVNEHVFISSLFFFLFALFSWKIEDWWLFFFFIVLTIFIYLCLSQCMTGKRNCSC
jgi:hypothetical protein